MRLRAQSMEEAALNQTLDFALLRFGPCRWKLAYMERSQSVPLMLSQSGFRSGSSIAARLTVCSSIAIAFLTHC